MRATDSRERVTHHGQVDEDQVAWTTDGQGQCWKGSIGKPQISLAADCFPLSPEQGCKQNLMCNTPR